MFRILVLFIGVLALASCRKDYECVCTYDDLETTTEYEGISNSEAETLQANCVFTEFCVWNEL